MPLFDGLGDWLGSNGSWLAPAVGAGLGAYGASQGQTTTNSMPPEFQPLAGAVAQRGLDIGNMAYTPYDQNRTAGFNPYQFAGMDMVANRAQQQGGLPAQAESALNRTISGGYLGAGNPYGQGNPYLEQGIQNTMGDMAQTYNQQVAPTMAATAYKSGSFGNTGQQEMETASRDQLQRNMGRVSGGMRMQDYGMQQSMFNDERNRMMQGLGQASNIYGMGYIPGQQMMGIGATMQQQGQNVLNDQYSQFQEAQNWPFRTYDAMRAPFGGVNPGGSTTQPGGSTAAGLLGGAMLGSQLWGSAQPSPTAINPQYGLPNYAIDPYGQRP